MKSFKNICLASLFAISILGSHISVWADEIGVVDMNKIYSNYSKAQLIAADLKVKETDLQKFVADARVDLKSCKSSDKKALEDKYNKQLQEKTSSLKTEEQKQLATIQQDVTFAIKNVADKKAIKSVFKKDSMVMGVTDLTDEVIQSLNSPSLASGSAPLPSSSKK